MADRAAWGEVAVDLAPDALELVRRFAPAAGATGPAQLVHGDLTGNVLLDEPRAAGIIDVSACWRPAQYAEGVVVADALAWHHARPDLPAVVGMPLEAVAMGLSFRIHTANLRYAAGRGTPATRYELSVCRGRRRPGSVSVGTVALDNVRRGRLVGSAGAGS